MLIILYSHIYINETTCWLKVKCTFKFFPGLSSDVQDPGADASLPVVARAVRLVTFYNYRA